MSFGTTMLLSFGSMFGAMIVGLYLGRKIKSPVLGNFTYLFAIAALLGALAVKEYYIGHNFDRLWLMPVSFSVGLLFFAMGSGASMRRTDEKRLDAYRKLERQWVAQVDKDRAVQQPLTVADSLRTLGDLRFYNLDDAKGAVDAYMEATTIYAQLKGNHPSLADFYSSLSKALAKVGRNKEAQTVKLLASGCNSSLYDWRIGPRN